MFEVIKTEGTARRGRFRCAHGGEDCRRLLPILEQLSDWAEARMPADESTTKKEEPQ